MKSSRVFTIASVKVFTLIGASVVVPVLAYVGYLKGNGSVNNGKSNYGGSYSAGKHIAVAPEANAGWMLVPFFGAVLLFSSRQLFSGKASEKNAG
jgi:hypothetical protein